MSIKKLSLAIVALAFVVGVTVVPVTAYAQQVPPVGYEKIPGPSKIPFYSNIIQFPNSIDLFGIRRPVASTPTTVSTPTTSTQTDSSGLDTSDIGSLFILDRLFSTNNGMAFLNTGGGGLTGSGGNNLGNLLLLDSIFGGSSSGLKGVLNGNGVTGDSGLGQLFILDRLFGNDNSGILGGGGDNAGLGNLILLDRVFGN